MTSSSGTEETTKSVNLIENPEDLNEPTELSVMWYYTAEFEAANGDD